MLHIYNISKNYILELSNTYKTKQTPRTRLFYFPLNISMLHLLKKFIDPYIKISPTSDIETNGSLNFFNYQSKNKYCIVDVDKKTGLVKIKKNQSQFK